MRPVMDTKPALGASVPQMICRSVDLPEPLRPMTPRV